MATAPAKRGVVAGLLVRVGDCVAEVDEMAAFPLGRCGMDGAIAARHLRSILCK